MKIRSYGVVAFNGLKVSRNHSMDKPACFTFNGVRSLSSYYDLISDQLKNRYLLSSLRYDCVIFNRVITFKLIVVGFLTFFCSQPQVLFRTSGHLFSFRLIRTLVCTNSYRTLDSRVPPLFFDGPYHVC